MVASWVSSKLTPICLDLNNNGLEYLAKADALNNCYFDFDNDGFAEKTEWIKPAEGFLVRDLNANDIIDNVTEMFGANGGTTAYTKLATLDTNHDGKLTGAELNSLKIWQDGNSNALTDAGELKTLASLGITSLSVSPLRPRRSPVIKWREHPLS